MFDLPFTRTYHPSYEAMGGVDAIKEVEFSIIQNRGCFGNCNFCAITFHQGRQVVSRSEQSILHEAEEMTHNPHFKGYIHDVGGPTADFRYPSCKKQLKYGLCQNRKCLAPKPCPQLEIDHMEYVELLRKLRRIKGVKKVFVRSGIRYDYLNADPNPTFLQELVKYHISGQLKVAPEHCVNHVLDKMGKPHIQDFDRFCKRFYEETKRIGQGAESGAFLDVLPPRLHHRRCGGAGSLPQAPPYAPGTGAGFLPHTRHQLHLYVLHRAGRRWSRSMFPKTAEEKFYQRTLLQYYKPENRHNVIQALIRAHGEGPHWQRLQNCLVAPDNEYIRTHTRRPAASSGNAPARKPNGTGAKPRKPVSRKSTVVNRGGVLTNDTRSSRKGRYR